MGSYHLSLSLYDDGSIGSAVHNRDRSAHLLYHLYFIIRLKASYDSSGMPDLSTHRLHGTLLSFNIDRRLFSLHFTGDILHIRLLAARSPLASRRDTFRDAGQG